MIKFSVTNISMILHINVHPGTKEESIEKISENSYNIRIKERAEKGKANAAVIRLLAKTLNLPQKSIHIKNPTSRKKIIEIDET